MFKLYGICIIIILVLFSCSSQDGLVLDEETPESIITRAKTAYDNQQYDQAIQMTQVLLDNFPTSDLHVDAQLVMAKSLGGKEKFEDQLDLLLRVLKENIIPEKVPLIYVQIADFYEGAAVWNPGNITSDSTDLIKAAEFYRKAVFYPNSNDNATKAMALYRAGLMYAKVNDLEKAKQAYSQVIESFPQSPYNDLARTKLLDPANTSELTPAAPEEFAQQLGVQPAEPGGATLPEATADSIGFDLPAQDTEEPLIIDTTQAIIPDAEN